MKYVLHGLVLFFFSLAGCVKNEEFPVESTYTFTNNTGERISFDLYATKDDYGKGINQINRYFIAPEGSQSIVLKIGEKYWIDWYNSTYSLNNWSSNVFNTLSEPAPELKVAAVNDTRIISSRQPDTIRSIILNGSGTSSTWKGTLSNSSTWNGTHEFTLRKDFTCEHVFTNTVGATTRRTISFQIERVSTSGGITSGFSIRTLSSQTNMDFRLTSNLAFGAPRTGRDSLTFLPFVSGSTYGVLKRQ